MARIPTVTDVINELGEASQSEFLSADLKTACEFASHMLDRLHDLSGVAMHCTTENFLEHVAQQMKDDKDIKETLNEILALIPNDCLRDGITESVQHLVEERRISREREDRLSEKLDNILSIVHEYAQNNRGE